MWTHFYDMHSGGGMKEEPYEHIYIEQALEKAVTVFYNKFGHNPYRVSCTCCGKDYSVSESKTIEEATEYQRKNLSVEGYQKKENVLFVFESEIAPEELEGEVPEQGYIWCD